jgi:[lysine-biosynthesis-protein LysW]--L-2-aminoadipate ligase
MRVAVVADRIGWEERRLLEAAADRDVDAFWLDDARVCARPHAEGVAPADAYLMRSRSYTRGRVLAGLLDDGGHRVVNSPAAIAACQNKLKTARLLWNAGLPTPDFRVVLTRSDLATAVAGIGVPCVLKPLFGGLGRRVLLIRERELADAAYDYVEHFGQGFDRVLLAQQYHPGHDVRVLVVGSTVVATYRRLPQSDWRANVSRGGAVESGAEDNGLGELAVAAAKLTGAEVSAVDLIVGPTGGPVVIEVNDVPMFRGAIEATGQDIAGAVIEYVVGGMA